MATEFINNDAKKIYGIVKEKASEFTEEAFTETKEKTKNLF